MLYIVPAAGKGQRFQDAGYHLPKPFLPMTDRRSMVDQVLGRAPFCAPCEKIVIISEGMSEAFCEHVERGCTLIEVPPTKGTSHTIAAALQGADGSALDLQSLLDQEVLVSNVDNVVEYDYEVFAAQCRASGKGCGVMVFKTYDSEKYSFVNRLPFFDEVTEKKDPTYKGLAIAGVYWFRTLRELLCGIEAQGVAIAALERDQEAQDHLYESGRTLQIRHAGECYLSLVMNTFREGGFAMLVAESDVRVFGTPEQYESHLRQYPNHEHNEIPF